MKSIISLKPESKIRSASSKAMIFKFFKSKKGESRIFSAALPGVATKTEALVFSFLIPPINNFELRCDILLDFLKAQKFVPVLQVVFYSLHRPYLVE